MSEPRDASREQFSAKPVGLTSPLGQQFAQRRWLRAVAARGNHMHPEELMKPALLSEIVLLFGTLIIASLVVFVATTLARS